MSLHTDGHGNWYTGEEMSARAAGAQQEGAAAILALSGLWWGPKLGALIGLSNGWGMILGLVGGGIAGMVAGTAIVMIALIGFLIYLFI
jgi:hypothetical protein